MTTAARVLGWKCAAAHADQRTAGTVASALGFDAAVIVDEGSQLAISTPAPGVTRARFVSDRAGARVAYVTLELAADAAPTVAQLRDALGEGRPLPVLPDSAEQPIDFGSLIAYAVGDVVRSVVLYLA